MNYYYDLFNELGKAQQILSCIYNTQVGDWDQKYKPLITSKVKMFFLSIVRGFSIQLFCCDSFLIYLGICSTDYSSIT